MLYVVFFFFFQAEDGIRDWSVTGVQTVCSSDLTAILDAYPDWKIPGKVRTLIPTADRQKATVKVRVSFDQLDPKILPDMGVKVSFLGEIGRASCRERV